MNASTNHFSAASALRARVETASLNTLALDGYQGGNYVNGRPKCKDLDSRPDSVRVNDDFGQRTTNMWLQDSDFSVRNAKVRSDSEGNILSSRVAAEDIYDAGSTIVLEKHESGGLFAPATTTYTSTTQETRGLFGRDKTERSQEAVFNSQGQLISYAQSYHV